MNKTEFQELFYYRFLIRNSFKKSHTEHGNLFVTCCYEHHALRIFDPSMEYTDTGMTIGERRQQLSEEIERYRPGFEMFGDFDKYQMSEKDFNLFMDINLTSQGWERDNRLIEFFKNLEK